MTLQLITGDCIHDNQTGQTYEVTRITTGGVHLTNGSEKLYLSNRKVETGIKAFRYGIIPNE